MAKGPNSAHGVFAMAESLSCATYVKSLSWHKVLQNKVAVATAPRLSMAAPVAAEQLNLQFVRSWGEKRRFFRL